MSFLCCQGQKQQMISPEEQSNIAIRRLNIYIDKYNREIIGLEQNVKICTQKAMEAKGRGQVTMAKFFIMKKQILEKNARDYQTKSTFLFQRKNLIEQQQNQRNFAQVLQETNSVLETHLNEKVLKEINRANQINYELEQVNENIANQITFDRDVNDEYDKLNIYDNEFLNNNKISISLSVNEIQQSHAPLELVNQQNQINKMKEIQVVVNLSGYGYNLFPYTEKTHKHLLPISNKPILAFVMEKLNQHFFTDFIFICNFQNRQSIEYYIKNKFKWIKKMPVNLQFYNPDSYQDLTQVLARLYCEQILIKDFLVINGDCLSDCNLNNLVDFHYKNNYAVTTVFSQAPNEIVLVMDEKEEKILKIVEKEQKLKLQFKGPHMKNNREMILKRNLKMNNIFMCDYRVGKILVKIFQKFADLGDEVLPFMVNNQYNKKLARDFYEEISFKTLKQFFQSPSENEKSEISEESFVEEFLDIKPLKFGVYVQKGICMEINSLEDYKKVNLDSVGFSKGKKLFFITENNEPIQEQEKDKKSRKMNIIAESAKVKSMDQIDKSVIGSNCRVEKAKVVSSLLMQGVMIGEGCEIQNSVLGINVVVKDGMKLINCIIGDEMTVHKNEEGFLENTTLTVLDNQVEVVRKKSVNIDQIVQINQQCQIQKI